MKKMSSCRYRYTKYQGKTITVHRLVWFEHYGYWPKAIDHINGNGHDNRIENLRECIQAENLQNMRRPGRWNSSGYLGVSARRGGYRASIRVAGKMKYLGHFNDPKEAHEAYLKAKRELHPFGTI